MQRDSPALQRLAHRLNKECNAKPTLSFLEAINVIL
jgi:hypothetical protein